MALIHLENDCLFGGDHFKESGYSKFYTNYFTGSPTATSNLDFLILQGLTFDCWQEGEETVFQFHGTQTFNFPKWIYKAIENRPIIYLKDERGFVLKFEKNLKKVTTKVINSPKGRNLKEFYDCWDFTKTGRGADFWKAMLSAIKAKKIEITK